MEISKLRSIQLFYPKSVKELVVGVADLLPEINEKFNCVAQELDEL